MAVLILTGCAKHAQGNAATATAPASPAAPASSGVAPAATATPANLLSWQSGTIVRSYPPGVEQPENSPEGGLEPQTGAKGPWVYVYELPGTAKLTRVGVTLPLKGENGETASASFAVSTTGQDAGFSDIATIASTAATDDTQYVNVNASARWVRVTLNRTGDIQLASSLEVYGDVPSPPPAMTVAGTYVQYDNPYDKSGKFRSAPDGTDPAYLQVVATGASSVNAEQCFKTEVGDSYPGTLDGRVWTWKSGEHSGSFAANDEGTMLVGNDGNPTYWIRTDTHPKYCAPQSTGRGAVNVLVLESDNWGGLYPVSNDNGAKDAPRYRFTHVGASLVNRQLLDSASATIFNGLCNADDLFNPAQEQTIARWVASGHKLLIYDSDMCDKTTHYALLPYQFQSDNPGAQGARGSRLIQVEDDSLGTSDKNDRAHYFDPLPYAHDPNNELGDANTVTTHDPNWCGHLFGTNVHHVNGFMQMYANYGQGVIIYDGFDHDDAGLDPYKRLRMLELDQPIPADLPCTQKASLAFLIEPNQTGTFVPGKATTLTFPMELLANQGWKGHIRVSASGDFKSAVTPDSFDTDGGTVPLKVAVSIPGSAKPGTYAVIVNGDGGNNQTAQATIQLTAAVPLIKQFQEKRVRIYGIHFDVDKATIKPQSESVIAEIAAVMKQHPSWRFRVEGHTDSDGGYQHNMVLSAHRAQAVVDDLVKRYHIARARLVPAGYGYSHPVAPNTSDAGKALNRRVELVRL